LLTPIAAAMAGCANFSEHGHAGIESDVVKKIAGFIK
jgi:hypothetical protein